MITHKQCLTGKFSMLASLALIGAALACSAPGAGQATGPTTGPSTAAPQPTEAAPTTAPASPRHVILESSDFSLSSYDANGQSTPFGKVDFRLSQGPHIEAGIAGGKLYAVSEGNANSKSAAYAIDASGAQPVPAIGDNREGLAVWGSDTGQARIAWGESDFQQQAVPSKLMIADAGAASGAEVYQMTSDKGMYVVPFRWSADGAQLYFSVEPSGLGGYILYGGHSSLYRLDTATKQSAELIAPDVEHSIICLDDLSPDFSMVGSHCDKQISVINLQTKQKTVIAPPEDIPADSIGLQGDVRFSPDGKRVAFGIAKGDSENEQSWVAVTDDLSGTSRLVVTGAPKMFYSVLGWLDNDHVLLALHGVNGDNWDSIQVLALDGSQPKEIAAHSIFVALVP